jgi:hypothetical protein
MNPSNIIDLVTSAFSGGTVTVILKLVLLTALASLIYWLYAKFKKAQIDAADAQTRKQQGSDQASTGPDTSDIANDGNAAEIPIDEIHKRKS